MSRVRTSVGDPRTMYVYPLRNQRSYGVVLFLVDILFLVLTGGFWAIFIYCREMRGGSGYSLIGWVFDVILTFLTFGFWLLWIFVRELRKRN